LDDRGIPTMSALADAWADADFYLSNSGSGFPAHAHAAAFHRRTGKPYGVFAVSFDPVSGFAHANPEGGTLEQIRARVGQLSADHLAPHLRELIDAAAFMFCRDTISRDYLRGQGVRTPILEFGPDAQLGMNLRNDAASERYLAARGLEPSKFICVIPRLRYTPYYRIHDQPPTDIDRAKDAINDRTREGDHAKLRDVIVRYVRATGHKVLACPEMTHEIALAKASLIDPLPDDVKPHVVWRSSFWLPDEAAAVYARALAVISLECHSPLIALHQGTPAMHVRQPTDTCKGQMYRDLGAGEWFFEVDETSGEALWACLEGICSDPLAARQKARSIMTAVEELQRRMADCVRAACPPEDGTAHRPR
jgi:hypothetical protein